MKKNYKYFYRATLEPTYELAQTCYRVSFSYHRLKGNKTETFSYFRLDPSWTPGWDLPTWCKIEADLQVSLKMLKNTIVGSSYEEALQDALEYVERIKELYYYSKGLSIPTEATTVEFDA